MRARIRDRRIMSLPCCQAQRPCGRAQTPLQLALQGQCDRPFPVTPSEPPIIRFCALQQLNAKTSDAAPIGGYLRAACPPFRHRPWPQRGAVIADRSHRGEHSGGARVSVADRLIGQEGRQRGLVVVTSGAHSERTRNRRRRPGTEMAAGLSTDIHDDAERLRHRGRQADHARRDTILRDTPL
jgi:hypothetical protein